MSAVKKWVASPSAQYPETSGMKVLLHSRKTVPARIMIWHLMKYKEFNLR